MFTVIMFCMPDYFDFSFFYSLFDTDGIFTGFAGNHGNDPAPSSDRVSAHVPDGQDFLHLYYTNYFFWRGLFKWTLSMKIKSERNGVLFTDNRME